MQKRKVYQALYSAQPNINNAFHFRKKPIGEKISQSPCFFLVGFIAQLRDYTCFWYFTSAQPNKCNVNKDSKKKQAHSLGRERWSKALPLSKCFIKSYLAVIGRLLGFSVQDLITISNISSNHSTGQRWRTCSSQVASCSLTAPVWLFF